MKQMKRRIPDPMSMVWLSPKVPKSKYQFFRDQPLVFLGEIPNMSGWCVIANCETGRIYAPYETKIFVEVTIEKVKR